MVSPGPFLVGRISPLCLMAFYAFCGRKRILSIVAGAAVFPGIHGIHGHLLRRLFHLEGLWMTLVTTEDLGVKLVAERGIPDALHLVRDGFLKGLHLMA